MERKILSIFAIFALLAGCDNNDVQKKVLTEDEQILAKAYSPTYMYPPGFNYEKNLEGPTVYENTVSVEKSQATWVELSTTDRQQAKYWSEISSNSDAYYRNVASIIETEKFFEFRRVFSNKPNDIILSRVHKSSYFIPVYDKFKQLSKVGTMKISPINTITVKDFVEYAWTNNLIGYADKVLDYSITEDSDKIHYNLKSMRITPGDWGLYATIKVTDFDFFVDKKSGEVSFESKLVKEVQGYRNNTSGIVE
jgi:hypothetical protein